jgi:hypothetical protein
MALTKQARVAKAIGSPLWPTRRAASTETIALAKKTLADWDAAALVKLMWEAWNYVFGRTLGAPSALRSRSSGNPVTKKDGTVRAHSGASSRTRSEARTHSTRVSMEDEKATPRRHAARALLRPGALHRAHRRMGRLRAGASTTRAISPPEASRRSSPSPRRSRSGTACGKLPWIQLVSIVRGIAW